MSLCIQCVRVQCEPLVFSSSSSLHLRALHWHLKFPLKSTFDVLLALLHGYHILTCIRCMHMNITCNTLSMLMSMEPHRDVDKCVCVAVLVGYVMLCTSVARLWWCASFISMSSFFISYDRIFSSSPFVISN